MSNVCQKKTLPDFQNQQCIQIHLSPPNNAPHQGAMIERSASPIFKAGFFFPCLLPKQTALHTQKIFREAAIPCTSGTNVPDKNLEGRKFEIFFPCLFDQISYLAYASFCLSYQDGLNGMGIKISSLQNFTHAHVHCRGGRRHTISNFPIFSNCKLILSQI